MSFVSNLKEEIQCYKADLDRFNEKDYAAAWAINNAACRKAIAYYDDTFCPLRREYEIVSEALKQIVRFYDTVEYISYRVVTDEAKRRNYKKLQAIREAVRKAFPQGLKVEKGENEVQVATEILKRRKEELSKQSIFYYDGKLKDYYLNEQEWQTSQELIEALIPIAFCSWTFPAKKYQNLLQLLTITTLDPNCASGCPSFGSTYSIVLCEEFTDFCLGLEKTSVCVESLNEKVFQTLSEDYFLEKGKEFVVCSRSYKQKFRLSVLNETFLNDLLRILETNDEFDLFSLSEYLCDFYGAMNSGTESAFEKLKELKRLYRETPDQILVTEQRYYQEKQLEQLRENAYEERKMMEAKAEEARKEYAYQEEQNRKQIEKNRRMQEINERENMRRMNEARRKEEDAAHAQKRNQQREAYQDKFRKSMEDESKRRQQMHLCWKCANYGRGCHGGIPACGNFRPKN